jgi:hypothetical protein
MNVPDVGLDTLLDLDGSILEQEAATGSRSRYGESRRRSMLTTASGTA